MKILLLVLYVGISTGFSSQDITLRSQSKYIITGRYIQPMGEGCKKVPKSITQKISDSLKSVYKKIQKITEDLSKSKEKKEIEQLFKDLENSNEKIRRLSVDNVTSATGQRNCEVKVVPFTLEKEGAFKRIPKGSIVTLHKDFLRNFKEKNKVINSTSTIWQAEDGQKNICDIKTKKIAFGRGDLGLEIKCMYDANINLDPKDRQNVNPNPENRQLDSQNKEDKQHLDSQNKLEQPIKVEQPIVKENTQNLANNLSDAEKVMLCKNPPQSADRWKRFNYTLEAYLEGLEIMVKEARRMGKGPQEEERIRKDAIDRLKETDYPEEVIEKALKSHQERLNQNKVYQNKAEQPIVEENSLSDLEEYLEDAEKNIRSENDPGKKRAMKNAILKEIKKAGYSEIDISKAYDNINKRLIQSATFQKQLNQKKLDRKATLEKIIKTNEDYISGEVNQRLRRDKRDNLILNLKQKGYTQDEIYEAYESFTEQFIKENEEWINKQPASKQEDMRKALHAKLLEMGHNNDSIIKAYASIERHNKEADLPLSNQKKDAKPSNQRQSTIQKQNTEYYSFKEEPLQVQDDDDYEGE